LFGSGVREGQAEPELLAAAVVDAGISRGEHGGRDQCSQKIRRGGATEAGIKNEKRERARCGGNGDGTEERVVAGSLSVADGIGKRRRRGERRERGERWW